MADPTALLESLQSISDRIESDMSERDIENLFLEQGFYDALGYEGTGTDLRSEFTLPDERRPDYITLDTNEAVTAVYEFKTSGRNLSPHESQLFGYMEFLQSEYGVLTNGQELRLYCRGDSNPMLVISMETVTESDARDLTDALQKRTFDLTDPDDVNQFLEDLDPIPLNQDAKLGQEHFFDTFRLEEGSPFADLITGMMDILHELRDEREADFVKGAYDFWEATYADEPDEVPNIWDPFINGKQSLRDFMFCLESGHALLSRLLLSKATEDHDFFVGTGYEGMESYFQGLQGFDSTINLDAFPVAADNLISHMQDHLVEGLFQDDIFVWWREAYKEQTDRDHDSIESQIQDVASFDDSTIVVTDEIEEIRGTRQRLSRAVAEVYLNVLRFDFSDVEGDLLGNLYQRYFDRETRKALGEFYTPQPVVDYIMDGVGYERGVSNKRLIDPSCGSGTFLVEAVERYIDDVEAFEDDPNWEEHLRDLCTRPRIVGLDIHPFAVLMAQIRFVVAILPAYREAKNQNPDFTLRRLPIYRTDTLRNERELTGADLGNERSGQMTFDAMKEDEQDVRIPVPLPIEVDEDETVETEGGFLVRRVRMPLFETIQLETGMKNFGEYFAALQGVLDTVKDHMALAEEFGGDFDWRYKSGLEERINQHTARNYPGVEEFFAPYVDDMLENVRYLKEEHNDGRLFKMFEDTVLALVVKNYMEYDYVVGNPPYVRVQNLPDRQKEMLDRLYNSTTGNYDLYCVFYERGLELLKEETGELGYITSNQFLLSDYGEGIRRVLLEDSTIEEVYDFRDSGVFDDAANLPVILFIRHDPDEKTRNDNKIRCSRVKSNINEPSQNELDKAVVESIREHRDKSRYSDEYIDVFDHPQQRLSQEPWTLMPPEEREVFDKLEAQSDGEINDIADVFQGVRTSKNKVYVVTVNDADKVLPKDSDETVTVSPIGDESKEYEIETDLLRPWLQGIDVQRWEADWSGRHLIHPYYVEESGEGVETGLYSPEYLKENLPLTWNYFKQYQETLESRERGRLRGEDEWYAYIYPKNLERFEKPKMMTADMSSRARYTIDPKGTWYFAAPYGVQLEDSKQNQTLEVACQLNSKVLDFYLKHISPMLLGGKYRYQSRYIHALPYLLEGGSQMALQQATSRGKEILATIEVENRINRFPEAYLGDYDGELDYITYEWQTRRYPVSAEVQRDVDGNFTVQAGRSDTISDAVMYSDDRDARQKRAEYVQAAVNGRNVKSGEEMTIPIPRSDEGVRVLLNRLHADREEVDKTDIDELEAEIDEAVYDLFDLTPDEREVIEDYLDVF